MKLSKRLKENKDFIFADQILRAGTSVGANIAEANHPQSRRDFYSKMYISLKEAEETKYWLNLLLEGTNSNPEVKELLNDLQEIIKMLSKTIITTRSRLKS